MNERCNMVLLTLQSRGSLGTYLAAHYSLGEGCLGTDRLYIPGGTLQFRGGVFGYR